MNTPQKSPEKMNDTPPHLSRLEAKLAEVVEQITHLQGQLTCSDMKNEDIDDIREQLSLLGRVEKAIKTEVIALKVGTGRSKDA
jgi:hypothetical protein